MTLFASFSLLIACGVERPDTNIYVVNAPGGYARGYNIRRDYDSSGVLKPGAHAIVVPAESVHDLNKFVCTDPQGFANLKAYIQKMREAAQGCN